MQVKDSAAILQLIIITMCEYCGSLDYALTNHDFAIPMQQI